jgi:glycosyltransferase involved in cell wall biosynthesis
VLVNDHAPNVETVGDAGIYFRGRSGVDDLAAQLDRLLNEPALVERYRARALRRARSYSWDAVTDEYERLLVEACEARRHGPLPPSMVDVQAPPLPEPRSAVA